MFILTRTGAVVVATALLGILLSPASIIAASAAPDDGQADVGEIGYTQNRSLPLDVEIDGDVITCFCVDYYGDLAELGAGYEVVSYDEVGDDWFDDNAHSNVAATIAARGDYTDSTVQRVVWHFQHGFSLRNDTQRELRDRVLSGYYTPIDIVLMAPLDHDDQPMACDDPTPPPPPTTTTVAPTTTTTAPPTTTTEAPPTTTVPPTTTLVVQTTTTTVPPTTTTEAPPTTTTVPPTTTTEAPPTTTTAPPTTTTEAPPTTTTAPPTTTTEAPPTTTVPPTTTTEPPGTITSIPSTTTTAPPTTTTEAPPTTTTEAPPTTSEAPTTTTEAPPTTTVPDKGDDDGDSQGTTPDDTPEDLAFTGAEVNSAALLGSIITAMGMMFMGLARRLREPEWY